MLTCKHIALATVVIDDSIHVYLNVQNIALVRCCHHNLALFCNSGVSYLCTMCADFTSSWLGGGKGSLLFNVKKKFSKYKCSAIGRPDLSGKQLFFRPCSAKFLSFVRTAKYIDFHQVFCFYPESPIIYIMGYNGHKNMADNMYFIIINLI